jgi:hypothetical protein
MLNFSSDIAELPERLRLAIREQQADAEILIAWVQLVIVLLFSLVYAAAPKAFPEMSRLEPVPLVLGAYVAITLSQLGLSPAARRHLARRLRRGGRGAAPRTDLELSHPIPAAAVLFAEGTDFAIRVYFHRAPRSPCRCRIRAPRRVRCGGGLDGARRLRPCREPARRGHPRLY